MLPVYATNKILKNTKVYKNIFIMTVSGNYDIIPGQFFMVRSWGIELLLSRPLSV
ncbi:MAG TPA: dihydroorotate dehydrogenase electron transfer subunit, partial [Clostridiaceae bacterium]|nr:dihydroorotate dehydrogenase electron transfer subunit [Clostridiaceae bacterium]